ncbi:collagen-binding domain-containing protein [Streptomyces sp. NPDC002784]
MSKAVKMNKVGRRSAPGTAVALLVAAAAPLALGGAALARDTVDIGNPVAGNNGFGVVTEGDAVLGSTESEGPVAIGGDLTFGDGYNVALHTAGSFVAPGDSVPTALLVGGKADYGASSPVGVLRVLGDGYVKVGDMTGGQALTTDANGAAVSTRVTAAGAGYDSTPRIELTARQPADSVGQSGLMDFTSLFSAYRDRADRMAACAGNVTLLDGNGDPLPDQTSIAAGSNIKIALTEGRTNVLHLTGEQLNDIGTLTLLDQPSASTPLLIVVDTSASGGDFTWHTPTMAGVSGTNAPYMLWDFPDATSLTIADGDTLEGTLYAPRAEVTDLDPANIEGDIIVKSLVAGPLTGGDSSSGPDAPVNAGEIHYFPFAADLQCEDTPTPTPDPTTPTADPTPDPTEPTGDPTEPTPDPTEPTWDPTTPTPDPTDPTWDPTTPTPDPSDPTADPTPDPSEPTDTPSTTPMPTPSPSKPTHSHHPRPDHHSPHPHHQRPDHHHPHHPKPGHSHPGLADTGDDVPVGALAATAASLTAAGVALLLWTTRRRRRRHQP